MNKVILIGRVCSSIRLKTTKSQTTLYQFHLFTNDNDTCARHNISTDSINAFKFIEDHKDHKKLYLQIEGKITYSKKYTNILASHICEVKEW